MNNPFYSWRKNPACNHIWQDGICTKCNSESLAKKCPKVANEWANTDRNREISNEGPDGVTYGCPKEADWKCNKCGHMWSVLIKHRCKKTGNGSGCGCGSPKTPNLECERCGPIPLSKQCPEVAEEWANTERNMKISNGKGPAGVTGSSSRKVDWKCNKCGHMWEASISNRCQKIGEGSGCGCGNNINPNLNCEKCGPISLSKQCPEVAKEWADTERNKEISNGKGPAGVPFGSGKEADWKCNKCGHIWAAVIQSRCKKIGEGSGCGCKKSGSDGFYHCSICSPDYQQTKPKWDEVFEGNNNE